MSFRNFTFCIYAFCPDLFISDKKYLLEQINKANIKISPSLICFEDTKKIIKIQRFLFPRSWTSYMKLTWLKNNNYLHLINTKVISMKNVVICKYYINKHKNYI
ncbi:hypothetical protein BGT96_15760 [Clostridioides difficile]|nr:hypothetical protein BGT96_15760 [Clostridioides difficile]